MEHRELLLGVKHAQEEVKKAERTVKLRITERAKAVQAALDAGVGATPIAKELNLGRHRIYQMRDQGTHK